MNTLQAKLDASLLISLNWKAALQAGLVMIKGINTSAEKIVQGSIELHGD